MPAGVYVIEIVQERSKRLEFCHSLLKVREEEIFEKKRVWKRNFGDKGKVLKRGEFL